MTATPVTTTKFNVLAIVGFILSFFGYLAVIGLILDIVAMNQIKRTGERGRNLALAGIIIAIVMIVLNVVIDATVLPSLMNMGR